MSQRNTFYDPSGQIAPYVWATNHSTEDAVQKSRQMGDGAQTSGIGLIPQQGPATPLVFQWEGTAFLDAQITSMMVFWNLSETQTVILRDFTGAEAEVVITDFNPQRVPCVSNPRCKDGNNPNAYYTWSYTITFRVLKALSGIWLQFNPDASS